MHVHIVLNGKLSVESTSKKYIECDNILSLISDLTFQLLPAMPSPTAICGMKIIPNGTASPALL